MLLTCLTSVIPNFITFLNIVGALGTSLLGFILPPIYYLQFYGKRKLNIFIVIFNYLLMIFGVAGGAYSIYNSIANLVKGSGGAGGH